MKAQQKTRGTVSVLYWYGFCTYGNKRTHQKGLKQLSKVHILYLCQLYKGTVSVHLLCYQREGDFQGTRKGRLSAEVKQLHPVRLVGSGNNKAQSNHLVFWLDYFTIQKQLKGMDNYTNRTEIIQEAYKGKVLKK